MGRYGDRARETLLDVAEEQFALHGIDAVSNRKITERAGTANHSAIAYHFGSRDGLIYALLARVHDDVIARRSTIAAGLPDSPTLRDLVHVGVRPWIDYLDSLPVPSYRARFTYQAMLLPSVAESLRADIDESLQPDSGPIGADGVSHVPAPVLRTRMRIVTGLTLGLSARYETELEAGTAEGNWASVGSFIADAVTGMLSAPVTHPDDFTRGFGAP